MKWSFISVHYAPTNLFRWPGIYVYAPPSIYSLWGFNYSFYRHNFLLMFVKKKNIWKPAGHQYFIFVFYMIPGQSVFFGILVLSKNISIYMSTVRLAQKSLMPCPSIGPKVLDGYKLLRLDPNHFSWDQIILVRLELDYSGLSFIIWTYLKWF